VGRYQMAGGEYIRAGGNIEELGGIPQALCTVKRPWRKYKQGATRNITRIFFATRVDVACKELCTTPATSLDLMGLETRPLCQRKA